MYLSSSPLVFRSTVLLMAAALISCEPSARNGAPVDDNDGTPDLSSVVTYAFKVPALEGEQMPLSPLVADLAQDPNLGRLTVADASKEQAAWELDVEYIFGTVDAFLAWREQARTAALLDSVAGLTPDTVRFRPRLAIRRPELYQTIVGRIEDTGGAGGRRAESVTCNEDCSRIEVKYKTRANEAGGAGAGQGTGDAGDIDSVTLICQPGLAGTIENCTASN